MGVLDFPHGRKRQPRPTPVTPEKLHELHLSLVAWAQALVLLGAAQVALLITLVIILAGD